ncbi:Vacuolar protein sorting-associated protein IST1 [Golovinomyces cichoracearum]|uniref:Vacuolar protein sorting-associated protein IST1 n=1 Tax=Golovinomyces cichoracearum TaxID=62708 RepID=A0A420IUQ8_9PEZI|nr:Vacuolar protein sorting-associated protein IST1 [Golovinomyces cichoracearum]
MAPSLSLIARLKVQLKLSITRLRMLQQKDEAVSKQQRRVMAQLLECGKYESAKIRVENIIRFDINSELHEMLELYCELLLARTGLLEGSICDPGLEEAVKSLIYAAPKTDVKELHQVRGLLCDKFGKEFALSAMANSDEKVNEKILKKLNVKPPSEELVYGYLEEIARTYGIEWPEKTRKDMHNPADCIDDISDKSISSLEQLKDELEEPLLVEGTVREELQRATPPRNIGPTSPLRVNLPGPRIDNLHPRVKGATDLNTTGESEGTSDGKDPKVPTGNSVPNFDELAARFAALKK